MCIFSFSSQVVSICLPLWELFSSNVLSKKLFLLTIAGRLGGSGSVQKFSDPEHWVEDNPYPFGICQVIYGKWSSEKVGNFFDDKKRGEKHFSFIFYCWQCSATDPVRFQTLSGSHLWEQTGSGSILVKYTSQQSYIFTQKIFYLNSLLFLNISDGALLNMSSKIIFYFVTPSILIEIAQSSWNCCSILTLLSSQFFCSNYKKSWKWTLESCSK
jgi:hypothetical protein